MPHLRQNLVTKQWVIISTERARRPQSLYLTQPTLSIDLPPYDPGCPFCPGNDGENETEFMHLPDNGEWQVRILGNKYPALQLQGKRERQFTGVERSMHGVGYHEVIVEGRQHHLSPATASHTLLTLTFLAFQRRGRQIAEDTRMDHIQYFKNHGSAAGASQIHPHSQLIALPVVPHSKRQRNEEAMRHFDEVGECAYCRMINDEKQSGLRVISSNEGAIAFVLYAANSPFHIWVLPRRHQSNFLEATQADIESVTCCLHDVLRMLHRGLNDPPYNYIVRSCPLRDQGKDYLHWYVSVVPRISTNAGFELGSGMFINSTLPEEAAAYLRESSNTDGSYTVE